MLGAGVAALALMRIGALGRRFRVKTMLRYPPIWASALIALGVFGFATTYQKSVPFSGWMTKLLGLAAAPTAVVLLGVVLAFVLRGLDQLNSSPLRSVKTTSKHPHRFSGVKDEDLPLLAWVMEEKPIRQPHEDMLGHVNIARRIARLLMGKASSNVGIVGPYGSGKTSVVNLVEYFMDHPSSLSWNSPEERFDGQFVRCRVDGWGHTSGAIAQYILTLCIDAVREYADCSSVIALPEDYRKAVSGANPAFGAAIAALFQATPDPRSQLNRLDNILAAAHLRLVLVLEDLDRNLNEQIMKDELPGLLDRLRRLDNIAFVLAIGTERQYSEILVRICDHQEAIS